MAGDVFRAGYLSAIHWNDGTVDVVYKDRDNAVVKDLPYPLLFLQQPKVDDPVHVLHLPNGRTAGLCLGRFWFDDWRPEGGKKGFFRLPFSRDQKKAYLEYGDPDESDGGDGTLLLHSDDAIKTESKSFVIEADSTIEVKAGATLTLKGSGAVKIEGGNIEISGGTVSLSGNVSAVQNDNQYLGHTHNCTAPGSPSGPPIPLE